MQEETGKLREARLGLGIDHQRLLMGPNPAGNGVIRGEFHAGAELGRKIDGSARQQALAISAEPGAEHDGAEKQRGKGLG